MVKKISIITLLTAVFFNCNAAFVAESSRKIPVIKQVDVLVVGGGSAAVAAAAAASKTGADVFLAAERPYLGADICRTQELWLGQSPKTELAKKAFKNHSPSGGGAEFEYSASIPADPRHPDTPIPSVLNDGIFSNASTQSVQFNQHVRIDVDIKSVQRVESVILYAYQRLGDFVVGGFELMSSIDGEKWVSQGNVSNPNAQEDIEKVELEATQTFDARFLALKVYKDEDIGRILLGELVIKTAQSIDNLYNQPLRPFDLKYNLDEVLLDTQTAFLYGCYPTEVLKDADGKLCGVVFANRAGRQAVVADIIIDASETAVVARLAGADFQPFVPGEKRFERVVVGGKYINTGIEYTKKPYLVEKKYEAVRYGFDINMEDDTFSEYCRAEQIARCLTWSPEQVDASERLIYEPCRKVITASANGYDALRAEGFANLFILSNRALGMSEELKSKVDIFEFAERLGGYVGSNRNKTKTSFSDMAVYNGNGKLLQGDLVTGEVKEFLGGPRSFEQNFDTVLSKDLKLDVIKGYDVVVIGGGTSGAPAAIAASRKGAKTLIVEYLDGLGGIGTSGLIGRYCIGIREGFTEQIDRGMADLGGYDYVVDNEGLGTPWDIELKKQWYRRELVRNGCDIWFGAIGCGAFVEQGVVKGAVVATPYGRVVVLADVVIDATGNSDIAVAAGSGEIYTDADTVEVQGTGLPPRQLGARYTNTDYSFVDDGDILDVWRIHITAKRKFKGSYDMAQLIDTRERRRIQGQFVVSPVDIYNGRTYPDTIARAYSNFDTHGYTTHSLFNIITPTHGDFIYADVPYRCMLPVGVDGIIVTGLGISAHRDAVPVLRMQPDVQNHGYAAGLAAAIASKQAVQPADIDVKQVQRLMVENGSLPESVLSQKDSFPLSDRDLADAAIAVSDNYTSAEILLSAPERSIPFLKKAYSEAKSPDTKLIYAHILGMLGSDYGVNTLIARIENADWDKGWNFTAYGQFGSTFSELDNYIIAAGFTRNPKVIAPVIAKAKQLDAASDFSHFCALARACDSLGDKRLAPVLYELLSKDGMSGYAFNDKSQITGSNPYSSGGKQIRNLNLREILLARTLYRCGDYNGLAEKILTEYASDLRGHYARCANAVLNE